MAPFFRPNNLYRLFNRVKLQRWLSEIRKPANTFLYEVNLELTSI